MLRYLFQNKKKNERQAKLCSFYTKDQHEYNIEVQIIPCDSKVISRTCAPSLELQTEKPISQCQELFLRQSASYCLESGRVYCRELKKGNIMATVVELRPIICHLHEHERALPDKHTLLSDCGYLTELYNTGRQQEPLHQWNISICLSLCPTYREYPCTPWRGSNVLALKLLRKHSRPEERTDILC